MQETQEIRDKMGQVLKSLQESGREAEIPALVDAYKKKYTVKLDGTKRDDSQPQGSYYSGLVSRPTNEAIGIASGVKELSIKYYNDRKKEAQDTTIGGTIKTIAADVVSAPIELVKSTVDTSVKWVAGDAIGSVLDIVPDKAYKQFGINGDPVYDTYKKAIKDFSGWEPGNLQERISGQYQTERGLGGDALTAGAVALTIGIGKSVLDSPLGFFYSGGSAAAVKSATKQISKKALTLTGKETAEETISVLSKVKEAALKVNPYVDDSAVYALANTADKSSISKFLAQEAVKNRNLIASGDRVAKALSTEEMYAKLASATAQPANALEKSTIDGIFRKLSITKPESVDAILKSSDIGFIKDFVAANKELGQTVVNISKSIKNTVSLKNLFLKQSDLVRLTPGVAEDVTAQLAHSIDKLKSVGEYTKKIIENGIGKIDGDIAKKIERDFSIASHHFKDITIDGAKITSDQLAEVYSKAQAIKYRGIVQGRKQFLDENTIIGGMSVGDYNKVFDLIKQFPELEKSIQSRILLRQHMTEKAAQRAFATGAISGKHYDFIKSENIKMNEKGYSYRPFYVEKGYDPALKSSDFVNSDYDLFRLVGSDKKIMSMEDSFMIKIRDLEKRIAQKELSDKLIPLQKEGVIDADLVSGVDLNDLDLIRVETEVNSKLIGKYKKENNRFQKAKQVAGSIFKDLDSENRYLDKMFNKIDKLSFGSKSISKIQSIVRKEMESLQEKIKKVVSSEGYKKTLSDYEEADAAFKISKSKLDDIEKNISNTRSVDEAAKLQEKADSLRSKIEKIKQERKNAFDKKEQWFKEKIYDGGDLPTWFMAMSDKTLKNVVKAKENLAEDVSKIVSKSLGRKVTDTENLAFGILKRQEKLASKIIKAQTEFEEKSVLKEINKGLIERFTEQNKKLREMADDLNSKIDDTLEGAAERSANVIPVIENGRVGKLIVHDANLAYALKGSAALQYNSWLDHVLGFQVSGAILKPAALFGNMFLKLFTTTLSPAFALKDYVRTFTTALLTSESVKASLGIVKNTGMSFVDSAVQIVSKTSELAFSTAKQIDINSVVDNPKAYIDMIDSLDANVIKKLSTGEKLTKEETKLFNQILETERAKIGFDRPASTKTSYFDPLEDKTKLASAFTKLENGMNSIQTFIQNPLNNNIIREQRDAFISAIKSGKTYQQAIYDSTERLYTRFPNFQNPSEFAKLLSIISPFANATISSNGQIIRAMKKNPKQLLKNLIVYETALATMEAISEKTNPEYHNLSENEKDNNIIIGELKIPIEQGFIPLHKLIKKMVRNSINDDITEVEQHKQYSIMFTDAMTQSINQSVGLGLDIDLGDKNPNENWASFFLRRFGSQIPIVDAIAKYSFDKNLYYNSKYKGLGNNPKYLNPFDIVAANTTSGSNLSPNQQLSLFFRWINPGRDLKTNRFYATPDTKYTGEIATEVYKMSDDVKYTQSKFDDFFKKYNGKDLVEVLPQMQKDTPDFIKTLSPEEIVLFNLVNRKIGETITDKKTKQSRNPLTSKDNPSLINVTDYTFSNEYKQYKDYQESNLAIIQTLRTLHHMGGENMDIFNSFMTENKIPSKTESFISEMIAKKIITVSNDNRVDFDDRLVLKFLEGKLNSQIEDINK